MPGGGRLPEWDLGLHGRARGDASGFYRLAAPLMARMVRGNITKDLELLKAHLEAQAPR